MDISAELSRTNVIQLAKVKKEKVGERTSGEETLVIDSVAAFVVAIILVPEGVCAETEMVERATTAVFKETITPIIVADDPESNLPTIPIVVVSLLRGILPSGETLT